MTLMCFKMAFLLWFIQRGTKHRGVGHLVSNSSPIIYLEISMSSNTRFESLLFPLHCRSYSFMKITLLITILSLEYILKQKSIYDISNFVLAQNCFKYLGSFVVECEF